MASLAGHLLIAAPEMPDDFFSETVVLLFQHEPEEGAAGVILNKPSETRVDDIWDELSPQNPHADQPIHIGGPCEGPLLAIHNSLVYAELPVIPGIALSWKSDHLRKLVQQAHQSVRLFSGYSGWAPEQLEREIEQGGWYSLDARPKYVFSDPVDLWSSACARFGDNIITPVAGQQIPADPSWN